MTLGPHEYRQLIRATLARAHDADTIAPDPRTLFTPPTHRLALDPDVTVVKGGRGVGKTVWFQALQDPVLREIAAAEYQLPRLTTTEPVVGYGLERAPQDRKSVV